MNEINSNKELFYQYYSRWIHIYKEGAIRKVTMAKYLMTLEWLKKLIPNLLLCDLNRITYQQLLNDYACYHERQTTMDFHHQLKGAILDAVDEGLFSSIDVPLQDIQAYEDDIFSEWQRICLKNQKKRVSKEHGVKLIKIDDKEMRNNVSKYITISNFTEDNITYKEGMSEEAS